MTVLAFIARRLYKRELPDLNNGVLKAEGVINKGFAHQNSQENNIIINQFELSHI